MIIHVNEIQRWNLYFDKKAEDPNPSLKGRVKKPKYALCLWSDKQLEKHYSIKTYAFLYSTSNENLEKYRGHIITVFGEKFSNFSKMNELQSSIKYFKKRSCHFDSRRVRSTNKNDLNTKTQKKEFLYFAKLTDSFTKSEIVGKIRESDPMKDYNFVKPSEGMLKELKDDILKELLNF